MVVKLVSDISFIILKSLLAQTPKTLCEWKHQLQYLAVCQQWRSIAVPIVYQTLIVMPLLRVLQPAKQDDIRVKQTCLAIKVYNKIFTRLNQHASTQQTHIVTCTDAFAYASNIDLAVMLGYSNQATRVVFCFEHETNTLEVLKKTVIKMQMYSLQWVNINYIQIHVQHNATHDDQTETAGITPLADSCASMVTRMFPNIKSMHTFNLISDNSIVQFVKQLYILYSSQLTLVNDHVEHIPISSCFTGPLQQLQLWSNSEFYKQLPKTNIDSLRVLSINNFVKHCKNGTFYNIDKSNIGHLEFQNLQSLTVRSLGKNIDAMNHEIHVGINIPRLRVLTVPFLHSSSLLTKVNYPDYLERLTIQNPDYGEIISHGVCFESNEREALSRHMQKNTFTEFFALAEYVANSTICGRKLHVVLNFSCIGPVLHTLDFNGFKSVGSYCINVQELVELISHLDTVETLAVNLNGHSIALSNDWIKNKLQPLTPINCSVQDLQILDATAQNAANFILFFQRIVLRVPSLVRLVVPAGRFDFGILVSEYKDMYPHISMLNIVYRH